jgi:hypothetical protein
MLVIFAANSLKFLQLLLFFVQQTGGGGDENLISPLGYNDFETLMDRTENDSLI